jgi:hypothetical protein
MEKTLNVFMFVLGGLVALAFFGTIGILIFVEVPQVNKDLLNIAIGAEIAAFTMIVSYFYGSSKGSADKTKLISQNGKTPTV